MTTTAKAKTTKAAQANPAKTTANEQDAFAIPTLASVDVPPAFRDIAETSLNQSKEAYENFKNTAEEAATALEESVEKTRSSVIEFNAKAVEIAQENTEATFSHVQDVFGVKTFADAIELQTAFLKKQIDALQDQAKTFQTLTTKITEETSAPYKTALRKTVETFKVA